MFSTNITAETTDEEILAPIRTAKKALARAVEEAVNDRPDTMYGEKLVNLAQEVRNAEALSSTWFTYRAYLQSPSGNSEAMRLRALFFLASHYDDRWSGRGNDSIRASHDEVVEWARDQIHHVSV